MDSKRNLSPKELRLLIRLLKMARLRVKSSSYEFLCFAIRGAATEYGYLECWHAAAYLSDWVHKMIGDSGTLDSWLYTHHRLPSLGYPDRTRKTRIAWVSWMIQQLQEEINNVDPA